MKLESSISRLEVKPILCYENHYGLSVLLQWSRPHYYTAVQLEQKQADCCGIKACAGKRTLSLRQRAFVPPPSLNLSGLDNSCTLKSHCTIDSFNTGSVLYPFLSFWIWSLGVSGEPDLGGKKIRLLRLLDSTNDLMNGVIEKLAVLHCSFLKGSNWYL